MCGTADADAGQHPTLLERICQALRQRPGLALAISVGKFPGIGGSYQADGMNCICCGSAAVTERPEVTARGYRRFRCRDCGRPFNQRSAGVLHRACLPCDIIVFVVFCRLRYRLTLRDLSEMLALRYRGQR
jgi:hypothetical protein